MENCIFCQIAQKKLQAQIRDEDQQVIAFDDINPKTPVHILVIPKKHIENVNKIAEEDTQVVGQLILAAAKLARQLKIETQGYRLIFNQGQHAGQVVNHLHLHLVGGQHLGPMVCQP